MGNAFQETGTAGKQGVSRRFARVWAGLVLAVVGVVAFAVFAAGDMQRQAAGAIPIIDAGSYVGTEHGEALLESGGLDVSWPRPEGFEGIWFEVEPFGRREHVVWESQRFVGKPVDIPKLKPGQAHENFVGLPDVCAPVIHERMRELGYTAHERLVENYNFVYSCNFANKSPKDIYKLDAVDVALRETTGVLTEPEIIDEYMKDARSEFVSFSETNPLGSCIARGEVLGKDKRIYLAAGVDDYESKVAMCRTNGLYWQVLKNLMGGY